MFALFYQKYKAKYGNISDENQQPAEKTFQNINLDNPSYRQIPGSIRKENKHFGAVLSNANSNNNVSKTNGPLADTSSTPFSPSEPAVHLGPSPCQDQSLQTRKLLGKAPGKGTKNPVRFLDNPVQSVSKPNPTTTTYSFESSEISPVPITVEKTLKQRVELAGRTPKLRFEFTMPSLQ